MQHRNAHDRRPLTTRLGDDVAHALQGFVFVGLVGEVRDIGTAFGMIAHRAGKNDHRTTTGMDRPVINFADIENGVSHRDSGVGTSNCSHGVNGTDPMPLRFPSSLLCLSMADDAHDFTEAPAPLPAHERPWRHPSEVAAQERFRSRLSVPNLSPFVAMVGGAVAIALIVALCLFIAPRNAPRESTTSVRNGAVFTAAGQIFSAPISGATNDGRALVPVGRLAIASSQEAFADALLITTKSSTSSPSATMRATLTDGRQVELRYVRGDDDLGLALYAVQSIPLASGPRIALSMTSPAPGTNVFIVGNNVTQAQVGVSVTIAGDVFVPLSDMVSTMVGTDLRSIPEGTPVLDRSNRLIGLLAHHGSVVGFVPAKAVGAFVSQAN